MDVDRAGSQWVDIHPISRVVREPHIMKMIQSASVKLADPSKLIIGSKLNNDNRCCFKLSSVEEAKKFVRKFNGKLMDEKGKDGAITKKMSVKVMVDFKDEIPDFEDSHWLRISNLNPEVSEKQLAQLIQKKMKKKPKFLAIYPHSKEDFPSLAIVQMNSAGDAQKAMKQLSMTDVKGQAIWVRKTRGRHYPRNQSLKGKTSGVIIDNLPAGMDGEEIRTQCSNHGTVQSVRMMKDKHGYSMRSAFVLMSNEKGAATVFTKLHQQEVQGCTTKTRFDELNGEKRSRPKKKKVKVSKKVLKKGKVKGKAFAGKDKLKGLSSKMKGMAIKGKGQKKRKNKKGVKK